MAPMWRASTPSSSAEAWKRALARCKEHAGLKAVQECAYLCSFGAHMDQPSFPPAKEERIYVSSSTGRTSQASSRPRMRKSMFQLPCWAMGVGSWHTRFTSPHAPASTLDSWKFAYLLGLVSIRSGPNRFLLRNDAKSIYFSFISI